MKLFDFKKKNIYGNEFLISFLKTKSYTLLQLSFYYDSYFAAPYFQLSIGQNNLLDILTYAGRFGIEMSLIGRTWND